MRTRCWTASISTSVFCCAMPPVRWREMAAARPASHWTKPPPRSPGWCGIRCRRGISHIAVAIRGTARLGRGSDGGSDLPVAAGTTRRLRHQERRPAASVWLFARLAGTEGGPLKLWACGVVIGDEPKMYLFDPRPGSAAAGTQGRGHCHTYPAPTTPPCWPS